MTTPSSEGNLIPLQGKAAGPQAGGAPGLPECFLPTRRRRVAVPSPLPKDLGLPLGLPSWAAVFCDFSGSCQPYDVPPCATGPSSLQVPVPKAHYMFQVGITGAGGQGVPPLLWVRL